MRDKVLENEVRVERNGGNKVDNIDGGVEEINFAWTTKKSNVKYVKFKQLLLDCQNLT